MPQAVHVRAGIALAAVAAHGVRLRDGHAPLHQHLDDLVVVGVGGQDDRGDVRAEVRQLLVQQGRGNLGGGGTIRRVLGLSADILSGLLRSVRFQFISKLFV